MTKINIQLFGQYQTRLNDEPITRYRSKKVQALLAYLVDGHADSHRRETLMALLWPDIEQKSAQVNLRKTLQRLRGLLPDVVETEGRQIRLNRELLDGGLVSADILTFNHLLTTNNHHDHAGIHGCPECLTRLGQAVALYHGPFLSDFYLPDNSDFEVWAASRREQYQRRYFDALSTLTKAKINQRDYVAAQNLARQQLALDPLREIAHRQLMEALARNSQRDEALAHYEQCRTLLHDELGMKPTQRTLQLVERIAGGDIDLLPPQTPDVRGYELLEKLGSGAYGDVHRAYQPLINREVAVKIIKPEYANRPNFIRRFESEAQTIAQLEHPYILPLYDFWRDSDGAFLVMRYMRGGSLADKLKQNEAWPRSQILRLTEQIGSALTASHQQGIVHRDIKPANILLDEEGNTYLADFGIARQILDDKTIKPRSFLSTSPHYTSPEQLRGLGGTPQSDIYAFGHLLFELLTGQHPFGEGAVGMLIQHHLNSLLPSAAALNDALPNAIDSVLQRATAKEPTERYESMHAFVAAVRQALMGDAVEAYAPLVAVIDENPFKGLRAFQQQDADRFFGRNHLTKQLIQTTEQSRFLTVVGPSGSGKSSVVKAGLLPQLQDGTIAGSDSWFIAEMVPGTHPFEELEAALLRVAVDPPSDLLETLQHNTRGLTRVLKRILPPAETNNGDRGQLLLVIDQFEELFTLVDDDGLRQRFISSLLSALDEPRSQLRLVVTLRADFYDRPLQHAELAKSMEANTIVVRPLDAVELEAAITKPAALAGTRFEAGLVTRIIDDVREQPGMLPLLQYALTELFERGENNRLTQAAYDEFGGIQGVLGRRAEEIFETFSAENQTLTRQLFLRLVTLGEGVEDTRRRVLQSELEALEADSNSDVQLPMTAYGTARLLSFDRDPITRTPTVEVAHEALLREWPRLRVWLQESREDLRMQRRLGVLSAEWQQDNQDSSMLLRGGQLSQFENWVEQTTVALTTDEQTFLDASLTERAQQFADEEARRQRELEQAQKLAETERQRSQEATLRASEQEASANRLRQRAFLLAGALAIAAVLAVAAFIFGNRATESANLAATREVEAQANALIAQENAALAETREAEANTQRTLAQEQARLALARELAAQAELALETDPELSLLLSIESLDLAHTKEAEATLHIGLQTSRLRRVDETGGQAAVSPNGTYLAVSETNENTFKIIDFETDEELFSGEGEIVGFINDTLVEVLLLPYDTRNMRLRVWDIEQQRQIDYPMAESFDFDGDPNEVGVWTNYSRSIKVSWYDDGHFTFWNGETAEEILTLEGSGHPISHMDFSPDGTLLSQGDFSNQINIWDTSSLLEKGEITLLDSFEIFGGASQGAGTQVFSTDNSKLFVVGSAGLEIWSLDDTSQPIGSFDDNEGNIGSIVLSPNESQVAIANNAGTIFVLDANTGELLFELIGQSDATVSGYSADGSILVSTGFFSDQTYYWDARPLNGSETQAFPSLQRSMRLEVSPDGTQIAATSAFGSALIIDRASGDILHTLTPAFGGIYRLDFSPDGTQIATVGEDDIVRLWDVATGNVVLEWQGHESGVFGSFFPGTMEVRYTPNGQQIATSSSDGLVKLWDVASGELIRTYTGYPNGLNQLAFTPDGTKMVGSGDPDIDGDAEVWVWDVETGENLTVLGSLPNQTWGMEMHPTEPIVAVSGWFGVLKTWNVETTEELYAFENLGNGIVPQSAFSPDGNLLVAGSNSAELFDAYTGEHLATLSDLDLGQLDFTPDNYLIGSAFNGGIREITVNIADALDLAQMRVTRDLSEAECLQYLRSADCEISFGE